MASIRLSDISEGRPIRLSDIADEEPAVLEKKPIRLSDIPITSGIADTAKMIGGVVPGLAEAFAQGIIGTGAALVGGGAGVGKGLVGLLAKEPFLENVAGGVRQAEEFTGKHIAPLLEPETRVGQGASKILSLIPQATRKAGELVAEGTESGGAGAVTEGGLNAALLLLGQKLGRGPRPVETPAIPPVAQTPALTPIAAAVKRGFAEPGPIEQLNVSTVAGRVVPTPKPGTATASIAQPVSSAIDVAYEPLFKTDVAPNISKNIADLAKDMLARQPELAEQVRQNNTRPIDFIMEQGLARKIPDETLARYDLSPDIFETIYRKTQADAGRTLAYLSRVKPRLTPEEAAALKELGGAVEDAAQAEPFWKRLTNIWRGALTTQMATAVRNAETQVGRIGLDVLQAPLDAAIQKGFGLPQKSNPLDGLETAAALFRKNKETVDLIFERFPTQKDRLFATYFSDLPVKKGPVDSVLSAAEHGVQLANFMNRLQEFIIRRAVFQTNLTQRTKLRGESLEQIITENKIGKIPLEDIQASVDKALDVTFGLQPSSKVGRAFVDAMNNLPGANIAIPFPRFLTQALKFNFEYNPLGILKLLSEKEKIALASGDTNVLSKAVIGTTMLTAAFAFRDSDYAGEKWYEAKNAATGETYDLRPFNPFVAYLWMADVGKKMNEGTLYKMTPKDFAMGLLSTNMRAGTGLYLLDKSLALMGQQGDEKKLETKFKEFSGELTSGFFIPLTTIRDFYDDYTTGVSIVRDTRQEPFLGPIKARIPGVSQTLPEAAIPTREGPKTIQHPAIRQLTGLVTSSPKNPLERELDRLGFDRAEVLPSSGDSRLDREYALVMGTLSQRIVSPFIESGQYQSLTDRQRGAVLSEVLKDVRADVRKFVNGSLPLEQQIQIELKKQPPRLRILIQDQLGGTRP